MILFRDTTARGGVRAPSWLEGCPGLYRQATEGGDILTLTEPIFLPTEPERLAWSDLGDGWQVAQGAKEANHNQYLRNRTDLQFVPARDAVGRPWMVPTILDKHGVVALPLPWGKDEQGIRVRRATPEQAKLVAIARAAHGELTADRLLSTPIDVLCSWVYPLLESAYHLTGDVIDALGLCDDALGVTAVLGAIGWDREGVEHGS